MDDEAAGCLTVVFRFGGIPLGILAVVLGLLWLIHGLATDEAGAMAGGWWKGPILAVAGFLLLAWRWERLNRE